MLMVQMQRIMYFPSPADMRCYVAFMRLEPDHVSDKSSSIQFKMLAHATSCMFMVHHKKWQLLRAFAEEGGLLALTALLGHENLYLCGQVRFWLKLDFPLNPEYIVT
jgi:hypothetical protein